MTSRQSLQEASTENNPIGVYRSNLGLATPSVIPLITRVHLGEPTQAHHLGRSVRFSLYIPSAEGSSTLQASQTRADSGQPQLRLSPLFLTSTSSPQRLLDNLVVQQNMDRITVPRGSSGVSIVRLGPNTILGSNIVYPWICRGDGLLRTSLQPGLRDPPSMQHYTVLGRIHKATRENKWCPAADWLAGENFKPPIWTEPTTFKVTHPVLPVPCLKPIPACFSTPSIAFGPKLMKPDVTRMSGHSPVLASPPSARELEAAPFRSGIGCHPLSTLPFSRTLLQTSFFQAQ